MLLLGGGKTGKLASLLLCCGAAQNLVGKLREVVTLQTEM